MPQWLARIIVHTVFSTKERRPFLRDRPMREELHRYLRGILQQLDCQLLIVGGVQDHVHLLSTLSRTCQQNEIIEALINNFPLYAAQEWSIILA